MGAIVAAGQYETTIGDRSGNLRRAMATVDRAADLDARLVVLPEYGLSGCDLDWYRRGAPEGAATLPDAMLDELAAHADGRSVSVIIGELERTRHGLHSSSFTLSVGEVVATYRKAHTTVAEEEAGLVAGDRRSRRRRAWLRGTDRHPRVHGS